MIKISSFFYHLRNRHKKIIIKLFAVLGYKLNSYHSFNAQVDNLLTGGSEEITVYNQFVPSHMRHPVDELRVGFWSLKKQDFNRLPHLAYTQFYGKLDKQGGEEIEFYFPLTLSVEYPGLLETLGKPQEVLVGVLNPSGRSIWLTPQERDPVCLKIDTMQLSERQFFSERALLVSGVLHSVAVTDYLKEDRFNCSEDGGGHLQFHYHDVDGHPKRYTYLLRHFDFKKLDIKKDDFIIPVVALLSTDFWSHESLKNQIGIKKSAYEFFMTDLAKCFADLISHSLRKTFIHFEVHQQNLSLHIQKGRGVKLIYHDLQDTVFDTVTFLLNRIEIHGLSQLSDDYSLAAKLQKNYTLNAHGHLLTHRREAREYFTVVSIYRRYIRNFGSYNKSVQYFANPVVNVEAYFSDKSFEGEILKHLDFGNDEYFKNRDHVSSEEDRKYLEGHLYWSMNQLHRNLQKQKLDKLIEIVEQNLNNFETLPPSSFENLIRTGTTLYSNGFPVHLDTIEFSDVSLVVKIYENKILLVTYKNVRFLIVRF